MLNFDKYFESEMHFLRESIKEFSNMKGKHFLESIAYLLAQIRRKIDDGIPEISEGLLIYLFPHALSHFPSVTIIQFYPRMGQLQTVYEIEKGTLIQSKMTGTSKKISCKFKTTSRVTINPITLSDTKIISTEKNDIIQLTFGIETIDFNQLHLNDLKLYIHANENLMTKIYYLLLKNVKKITLKVCEKEFLLESACINACNFAQEDFLLPKTECSYFGFYLLREYFLFKKKYAFISINGFERIPWHRFKKEFVLNLYLDRSIDNYEYNIGKDTFRLHCTPAINLFEQTSEPVNLNNKHYAYPVTADADDESTLIYSVDSVIGIDELSKKTAYYPVHHFQDDSDKQYMITKRNDKTYISLSKDNLDNEYLSCSVTCSNGTHPSEHVKNGEINISPADFPECIKFENITKPTRMILPPVEKNYRWLLVSSLSLNYSLIDNADKLKVLLSLYSNAENKERIEGIQSLDVRPINKIKKGILTFGMNFNLQLNEKKFSSISDIFLFCSVLHHFFIMYAKINSFVETNVVCKPSEQEFVWN